MNKNDTKSRFEKPNQENQRQSIIKIQNECYLCGKALNTHIEHMPKTRFIVERAQCHSCMTVARVKNHSLQ